MIELLIFGLVTALSIYIFLYENLSKRVTDLEDSFELMCIRQFHSEDREEDQ